jgi:hypothetical protein
MSYVELGFADQESERVQDLSQRTLLPEFSIPWIPWGKAPSTGIDEIVTMQQQLVVVPTIARVLAICIA